MGNCDSSKENFRVNNNSKISTLKKKASSHPNLSENKNTTEKSKLNFKKNNSVNQIGSLQNKLYILPERIAKRENITKKYKITKKILGEGATSKVYLAENSSGEKFAIKRISKDNIKHSKNLILQEAEICLILNNKNIIKYYEIYEDLNFVSIVKEPAETDLFELIINNHLGNVPEEIAIDFLLQILEVIDYLHSNINIVHCDIKPENFVVKFDKENGNKPILKLIDFGNAQRKPLNNEKLYNFCGTKEFMAPEALEKSGFDEKVDEWAAGIIMYHMLTGLDPFISSNDNDNELDYINNIKYKEIKFQYIKNEKLRKLNKKLLNRYAVKRITAKQALKELKQIKNESFSNDINNNINIKDYERNLKSCIIKSL